jgi:glutathione S-transferase
MQAKLLRDITPPQDLVQIAYGSPSTVKPVNAEGLDVTVYTIPTSICSQRARLTLEEKKIHYHDYSVNMREMENLEPWYLAMNGRGLVPTLKFGDRTLFDSVTIMLFVDAYFEGPLLSPSDESARAEMIGWLKRMDEFPTRDLSFRWQMERTKKGQPDYWTPALYDNVREAMEKFPEHRALYERKLQEWADIQKCVNDPAHMAQAERTADELAADMDAAVSQGGYLVGGAFSLADISAIATLMRVQCGCGLKLWGDGLRPELEGYVERLKSRDSYRPGLLDPYRGSPVFNLEGECWLPMRRAA